MNKQQSLSEAYKNAAYRIGGHGIRNIQVLKDALADVDGDADGDMYGKGKLIEDFQAKMAEVLGKPAAVFFPSGTMAQQIALRIWCDEQGLKSVAYHPLCHLEIFEEDGLKELHHIEPVLLADKTRTIGLEDVLGMTDGVACLLLELPQREIGGQLPAYEEIEAISVHCREKGIKLHLDGARLFEILPYYRKTAAEICGLFDSVYVSFYKGIGGVAGAILAGDEAFLAQSKIWKRRYGGDLISLYPYILSSDYYFERRVPKMDQYYREALELAELFNGCHGIATKPLVPVSNMFHVHVDLPQERFEEALLAACESGIGIAPSARAVSDTTCYLEISIGDLYETIPKDELRKAFKALDEKIKELSQS